MSDTAKAEKEARGKVAKAIKLMEQAQAILKKAQWHYDPIIDALDELDLTYRELQEYSQD